jgi:non-ribosomal peptide synthetase component F
LIASIDENDAAFVEYLGRPDATREKLENGWYRTSDAAVLLPVAISRSGARWTI